MSRILRTQKSHCWQWVSAIVVLFFVVSFVSLAVSAEGPVVKMYLFHSADCPDCRAIVNEYLPALYQKYGNKIQVQLMGIEDPKAYELLVNLERTFNVPADLATVPEVFVGGRVLFGQEQIRKELEGIIDELLKAGGADFPVAKLPTPTPQGGIPTVTPHPQVSVEGGVHVMLFFSPTCPHCHHVRENVLPPLYEKYGEKLVVREFDVSNPYYFALELAIEETAGLPKDKQGYVPLAVVGPYLLTNASVIEQALDELIQEGLKQGGIPWPIDPKYFEEVSPTPTVALTREAGMASSPAPKAIHMAYFYKVGCQECDRATYEINYLKSKYPALVVDVFDIAEHAALNEWLATRYNVPDRYHLTAPSIFVGEDYLVGENVSTRDIERLIEKYSVEGAPRTWENWEAEAPQAASRIIERFRSFGGLTVVAAGLIDGLNPCAFATIVFFISYLAFAGRKGREILLVGGAFALGVFLTYLLVGFGLYQILGRLPFLTTLGRWVYGITAAICLILAIMSVLDFLAARRGRPEEMKLKLPLRLRRRINQVIREGASAQAIAGVAFVTGFVISIIELACTGQVYLPTILFVMGVEELRARAILYLLLYNVMFILPLIVVFVLAYFGTTSEQLGQFVNRNTARIKLATAVLFVVLGGWLVTLLL